MWTNHFFMLAAASALGTPTSAPSLPNAPSTQETEPHAVVTFWKDAGPALWFAKDPAFDDRFRTRFAESHELAARGRLDRWLDSAEGALALCLLLDQYPRNSFRGTPRMYATDEQARSIALAALERGLDLQVELALSLFLYLPLSHSESIADQERAVLLAERLGEDALRHARGHRDIVRRFGRFPHRNPILGRATTPDEQRFLDQGGFAG